MPYEYDVFISYSNKWLIKEWVASHFVKRFEFWLGQEFLDRDPTIFWDKKGIEPGDEWPEALRVALQRSRCLVAVWSPSYFRSTWCVAEFESFRRRAITVKAEVKKLVVPLQWHDGEHFPVEARKLQYDPFEAYTSLVPNTPVFADFDQAVMRFAKATKKAIDLAPPEALDWPVVNPAEIEDLIVKDPNTAKCIINFVDPGIKNPKG